MSENDAKTIKKKVSDYPHRRTIGFSPQQLKLLVEAANSRGCSENFIIRESVDTHCRRVLSDARRNLTVNK